jgi:hypothetical protein
MSRLLRRVLHLLRQRRHERELADKTESHRSNIGAKATRIDPIAAPHCE